MRLKEVYSICNKYMKKIPEIDIKRLFSDKVKPKSIVKRDDMKFVEPYYIIDILDEKWGQILEELADLEQIPTLSLAVKDIKEILMIDNNIRESFTEEEKGKLIKNFKNLSIQMKTIIDLCETYGYISEEYVGFDLKLPINKDFTSIAKVLNSFDKIINQAPFLNNHEATIEYKKVDLGSTWIEFVINGVASITLLHVLSRFVDDCIKILSHKKNCKQQEESYRRMQIDNEIIEGMVKAHNKMTDALTDKFIKELSGEIEPEDQSRARLCFDMMIELLDKGVEIHQAITENESNELLFPTTEKWNEIGSNVIMQESIEQRNKEMG